MRNNKMMDKDWGSFIKIFHFFWNIMLYSIKYINLSVEVQDFYMFTHASNHHPDLDREYFYHLIECPPTASKPVPRQSQHYLVSCPIDEGQDTVFTLTTNAQCQSIHVPLPLCVWGNIPNDLYESFQFYYSRKEMLSKVFSPKGP